MTPCNYIPFEAADHFYLDEIFDLDILCSEEGILINVEAEEPQPFLPSTFTQIAV